MWIVLKFKRKEQNYLVKELKEKVGKDVKIYIPKINIKLFSKNKVINSKKPLLGDYLFCYHSNFKDLNFLSTINFLKGLKYILKDFISSQKEINFFIDRCNFYENNEGFLSQDFFNFENLKRFKFLSGPFTNLVFDLIEKENKNNLKCLIGDFKLTITGKNNLFFPA
tara:strand:- start:509 stop:1009 length:501 start_codon:yes stop_codon:yes gene_type:complete